MVREKFPAPAIQSLILPVSQDKHGSASTYCTAKILARACSEQDWGARTFENQPIPRYHTLFPSADPPMTFQISSSKAIEICDYLKDQRITPKEFFHTFLHSQHPTLHKRKDNWASLHGIESTGKLLRGLKNIYLATELGRKAWHAFILAEVLLPSCSCLHL